MISYCYDKPAWDKRSSRKRMMPEEGKTDSESSCSFFGKRKAVTRKNALCLRRKRTRKAAVSSSKTKADTRKNALRLQKIYLELPRRGIPYPVFFETPSAGAPPFCLTSSATSPASTGESAFVTRARGRLRMTRMARFGIITYVFCRTRGGLR